MDGSGLSLIDVGDLCVNAANGTLQQSLITELEQSGFRVVTANVYERDEINHITIHAVKVVYSQ